MIDWDFIFSPNIEGFALQGYVPKIGTELSKASGVTIGGGFDFGRRTARDLVDLPSELRLRVMPYLGLRGEAALAYLKQHPLLMKCNEIMLLMRPLQRSAEADLVHTYAMGSPKYLWNELSNGPQTVLMSLKWQYGDPEKDAQCGRAFRMALDGCWDTLAHYLTHSFPDKRFHARRMAEAAYLLQHINTDRTHTS